MYAEVSVAARSKRTSASVIRPSPKARSPSLRYDSGSVGNFTAAFSSSSRACGSWFTAIQRVAIITPGGGSLGLLLLARSRIARQPSMSRSRNRSIALVISLFIASSETALPMSAWAVIWACTAAPPAAAAMATRAITRRRNVNLKP